MRGTPGRQAAVYHTFNVEHLIEPGHPLRPIKRMVDRALGDMSRAFKATYSDRGRPGIPPEMLLKAFLPQCLYTIRSERELCRRLQTDLLFRGFLDLQHSDEVFDHSVFTPNRERLSTHGITQKFFDQVVKQAISAGHTSDEHFTVDGSLIQSHASLKSLRKIEREATTRDDDDHAGSSPSSSPRDAGRNPSVNFKGERRTNATHASATDPEARLFRKGDGVGAFQCHSAHALTENRHGLEMSVRVDEATGTAERENTEPTPEKTGRGVLRVGEDGGGAETGPARGTRNDPTGLRAGRRGVQPGADEDPAGHVSAELKGPTISPPEAPAATPRETHTPCRLGDCSTPC